MNPKTLKEFELHTKEEYPKEACGFILSIKGKERYFKACNIAEHVEEHFIIDPVSYADAEDTGQIIAICHSHTDTSCKPSEQDKYSCEASKIPWYILSWPGNELYSWSPSSYDIPLLGRTFSYGVSDCCTLIRDFYKKELNINFECLCGQDDWWDRGENRYLDNYEKQGFVEVDNYKKYDVFLIKLKSSVPNLAAIFIGEDKILHHVNGRLSNRELYRPYMRKNTTNYLRHKSLC